MTDSKKNIYLLVTGTDWNVLPEIVKSFFAGGFGRHGRGRLKICRGGNPLSRFIGWFERLPERGEDLDSEILINSEDGAESWRRRFGKHIIVSEQRIEDDFLVERFGMMDFFFRLEVKDRRLVYVQERVQLDFHVFTMPLPDWIAPRIDLKVWEIKDKAKSLLGMKFRVTSFLTGLIWGYEGALDID